MTHNILLQVKRRLDMEHGSPVVFKTPSPVVHSKKIKLIAPKQESPQVKTDRNTHEDFMMLNLYHI